MAKEIEVITGYQELSDKAQVFANHNAFSAAKPDGILISQIDGGLLNFASAAFPSASVNDIYAKHEIRSSQGKGPHFDIYGDGLMDEYPYIAVYNLAGKAALRATVLPEDMSKMYFDTFPKPSPEATEARRNFSSIALSIGGKVIAEADIDEGTGIILLQKPEGPHIIHEIVPRHQQEPGEFVKLACPSDDEAGRQVIDDGGLVKLDQLITSGLQNRTELNVPPATSVIPEDYGDGLLDAGPGVRSSVSDGLLD